MHFEYETFTCLLHFFALVKNQFHSTIKCLDDEWNQPKGKKLLMLWGCKFGGSFIGLHLYLRHHARWSMQEVKFKCTIEVCINCKKLKTNLCGIYSSQENFNAHKALVFYSISLPRHHLMMQRALILLKRFNNQTIYKFFKHIKSKQDHQLLKTIFTDILVQHCSLYGKV